MFRGTLTLLARSLRLDARLRRAHAFRFASIAVVFWLLVAAHINTAGVSAPGLAFYKLICFLCFGLISVAGAGLFSSAITEEKEAGTLSLLLMAGVAAVAILIGKSTTRLVSSLLIFSGIFPFTLLALALGGVTVHQIWSGMLALAAYLVFVANVGVLASVVSRTTGRASVYTTLVLLLLFSLPILGPSLIRALVKSQWMAAGGGLEQGLGSVVDTLTVISPVTRFEEILVTGFDQSAWSGQVVSHLVLGLSCFAAAWIGFPIFCEGISEDVPSRAGVARVRAGRTGVARWLIPRPWKNAMLWKDFQFIAGGVTGLALRMIFIPIAILLMVQSADLVRLGLNLTKGEALRRGLLLIGSL
jgi:ABC-type transport system involved in multi-copper enzyme maturation permease subunit